MLPSPTSSSVASGPAAQTPCASATIRRLNPTEFLDGPAGPAFALLPYELWENMLRFLDADGQRALSQVDRDLSAFALPAARADARAATSSTVRQHGLRVVRRAVAPLERVAGDSPAQRAYLHDLVRLADAIGADWHQADALSIVLRQLAKAVPMLRPDHGRELLIHLLRIHKRCDEQCRKGEKGRRGGVLRDLAAQWRTRLAADLVHLRRANDTCGLIAPAQWTALSDGYPECSPS